MRHKAISLLLFGMALGLPYGWAGQGEVMTPESVFTQYGCKQCHTEKGELVEGLLGEQGQGGG
jgi:cytochrome c551/c552